MLKSTAGQDDQLVGAEITFGTAGMGHQTLRRTPGTRGWRTLARRSRRSVAVVTGRRPACARCGGTGYVYLWSVARAGSRVWYCDRSTCKWFWPDARSSVAAVADTAPLLHALPPLVSTSI